METDKHNKRYYRKKIRKKYKGFGTEELLKTANDADKLA